MMKDILDAGIALIVYLQSLGDWLIPPMKFFTFVGREEFYLMFMPALYWCLDAGMGLRVGILLLLSNGLNEVLKLVLRAPRPYLFSSQVRALAGEPTFGSPSAHAQVSAAVWGLFAVLAGRRWPKYRRAVWILVILLVFFIGSSRMLLGVHFPHDVIFGWVVGAVLVWGFLKLEARVKARLMEQSYPNQLVAILSTSLVMILLAAVVKLNLSGWTVPAEWLTNFALAGPGLPEPDPLALSGTISNAGALFGLAAGALWLRQRGGFEAQGAWKARLLRYPVGLLGVLLIWYGLGAVFPRGELIVPYMLRYLRYALIGLWISALAPVVFMRLGLAERQADDPRSVFVEG